MVIGVSYGFALHIFIRIYIEINSITFGLTKSKISRHRRCQFCKQNTKGHTQFTNIISNRQQIAKNMNSTQKFIEGMRSVTLDICRMFWKIGLYLQRLLYGKIVLLLYAIRVIFAHASRYTHLAVFLCVQP